MPQKGDDWTASEESTLQNHWDTHTAQDIADMLPNRTLDAVYSKHQRMKENGRTGGSSSPANQEKSTKPTIRVTISRDTFIKAWRKSIEDRWSGRRTKTGIRIPLKGKKPEDVDQATAEAYRPRPNARYPDPESRPIQLAMYGFYQHSRFRTHSLDGDYYSSFNEMVNEESLSPSDFDVESFDALSEEEKERQLELNNDIYFDSVWTQAQNIQKMEIERAILRFNWKG